MKISSVYLYFRYYVVEKFDPSDNFDLNPQNSEEYTEDVTSTPPSYELILGLNDPKEVISKDVAIQTVEPTELCCRLRLVSRKSDMSQDFIPESSIEVNDRKREEFLVCKNPSHASSGDHCCSKRLYTIKSSSMSRENKGMFYFRSENRIFIRFYRNYHFNSITIPTKKPIFVVEKIKKIIDDFNYQFELYR